MSGKLEYGLLPKESQRVMDGAVARRLFRKFCSEERRNSDLEAERLFFMNETEFLGGVERCLVNDHDGIPCNMFVGEWKYQEGVYVREGINAGGLAVLIPGDCWKTLMDIRTDSEQRGFFSGPVTLKHLNEYLPLLNAIVKGVEGYESIVEARRFGKK